MDLDPQPPDRTPDDPEPRPVGDAARSLSSPRWLFVQLIGLECTQPLRCDAVTESLVRSVTNAPGGAVLYADLNHPRGLGVISWSEQPRLLARTVRSMVNDPAHAAEVRVRSECSMLGHTYLTGFETEPESWLLHRPVKTLTEPSSDYAVFYPLRRHGSFEQLAPERKASIMREHGGIGRQYADQDLVHDVRLACHGLDINDNDFVIGLLGRELAPLSQIVKDMRRTQQTAEFIQRMGPFFVGQVLARNPGT